MIHYLQGASSFSNSWIIVATADILQTTATLSQEIKKKQAAKIFLNSKIIGETKFIDFEHYFYRLFKSQ